VPWRGLMTGSDVAWAKHTAAVKDRRWVSPPISARDAGGVGSALTTVLDR